MQFVLFASAAFIFILFLYAAGISRMENENRAAKRLFWLGLLASLPYFLAAILEFDYRAETGVVLLSATALVLLALLLPMGRNPRKYTFATPQIRIDERDTMFSRNELEPGSNRYAEYYKERPDKKIVDDAWRQAPGLLKPGSSQYHPLQFAAADASFETIEALKHEVDGPVNPVATPVEAYEASAFLRGWAKKLGALDVGFTALKDYHLYSTGGRAERYGKAYERRHANAMAFTVEMAHEMVAAAPSASIVMESGQQYLESGKVAIQVAKFIRNLGYEARAHIDGNYEVVCPLVARDAGLGEIGRMGLLMTPHQGPRVRIAVVTTNMPLVTDRPLNETSMIDFCTVCKKCADACPGRAISFEDQQMIDGVKRWQISQEACFALWCTLGTDCGRCLSVCPYAHPDNAMHKVVRAGIRNSALFRRVALKLDDFIYGRKPAPATPGNWLDIEPAPANKKD